MPTITEENAKPIRQALTVVCGMDIPSDITVTARSTMTYDSVSGDVSGIPVHTPYMDLSFGGFLNDGQARPLEKDHIGFIAKVGIPTQSIINLILTLSEAPTEAVTVKIYYYTDSPELKSETRTMTSQTLTTSISSRQGRVHIVKVTVGEAWWFNNDSLISCTLALRSVETKPDNPELQMSDIEIVGYEPNNVLEQISQIGEDIPVYYTSGYPGDMAPVRKFYLSEPIKWQNKQLTIKAEDATKFLDDEFLGQFIGNASRGGGGTTRHITAIHDMLVNAGITHEYVNDYTEAPYDTGSPILLPKTSKRQILAQAVNLYHCELGAAFNWPPASRKPLFLNYVDAGRPRLWTGRSETYTVVDDIADLEHNTDRMAATAHIQAYVPNVSSSTKIESVETYGETIRDTSEPYYSFITSLGTITKVSPYRYKINASGTADISGRKITPYDRTTPPGGYNLDRSDGKGIGTLNIDDFYGWQFFTEGSPGGIQDILYGLLYRSIETYKFTWRGDPRLQPRDHIRVMIDGEWIDMTIDTVSMEHSGGGLTSEIYARKGWL